MKVSLIVSTYNSKDFIKDCLDSILEQSYNNIEIIIIDGKSTDGTVEFLKSYCNLNSNIFLVSEKDRGIYDALNKGVCKASGELIGFVHSDDFLVSSTIISEISKKIIKENLDGIYGDLHYVHKHNTNKIIRKWESCEFNRSLLKNGWMPAHPTFFLKKSVYEKHGLFDLNYSISSDYDFMLRVLLDETLKFGYLPKIIIKMRVGGISNRNISSIMKKSIEDYRVLKKNNVGGYITLIKKNLSKLKQFFKN